MPIVQEKSHHKQIIPALDVELLSIEIASIQNFLIQTKAVYQTFLVDSGKIPHLLREIGRLRELSFREVGEGTGNSLDIDEYDKHYLQLFIWDTENLCVVGGYRLGPGPKLFKEFGVKGFYLHSLFRMSTGFFSVLESSLELGRSFIIPTYQKKALPLYLLWSGILQYLLIHPECRYLIGPVSISKFYSDTSKSIIVSFIEKFCYDTHYSQFISPRVEFKPQMGEINFSESFSEPSYTLKDLEAFMNKIEPEHIKVPILIKKYVKQNANFVGFNIDPDFSDSLDGLMMMDIQKLPAETLKLLKK